MSLGIRSKSKRRALTLALVPASILLAMPVAQAHVDIGLGLNVPAVVAPPPVVAAPPAYYYAPGFGFSWYDSFGHRHWDHRHRDRDRWGHDRGDDHHGTWGHNAGGRS